MRNVEEGLSMVDMMNENEPSEVVTCNGVPLTCERNDEGENDYVYDVYYAESGDVDDAYLDQLMRFFC